MSTYVTAVHQILGVSDGSIFASGAPGTDDATIDTAAAAMLVEKVPDLANLILASTFLGQFLTDRPFRSFRRLWVSWSGPAWQ